MKIWRNILLIYLIAKCFPIWCKGWLTWIKFNDKITTEMSFINVRLRSGRENEELSVSTVCVIHDVSSTFERKFFLIHNKLSRNNTKVWKSRIGVVEYWNTARLSYKKPTTECCDRRFLRRKMYFPENWFVFDFILSMDKLNQNIERFRIPFPLRGLAKADNW